MTTMTAAAASRFRARAIAATATLATAVLVPSLCFAFAVTTINSNSKVIKRWKKQNVTYYLHPNGSTDMSAKASLDEVRKSFKDWQNVPCGSLTFSEGYHCNTALKKCLFNKGKSCTKDADCPAAMNTSVLPITGKYNKRSEFVWIENAQWKHGLYVLGVTVAITNWAGQIVESDIAMNGYMHKWTNDPYEATKKSKVQHIKSVAIHEIGHFIGINHMLGGWSNADPPTMAPNVMPNGKSASLNADDKKAICYLNPTGGSYKCYSNADCPYINHKNKQTGKEYYAAKLKCQSGKCYWGAPPKGGTTNMGGQCSSKNDCVSGLECVPLNATLSLCSKQCLVSGTSCGSAFFCAKAQSSGNQGWCLPLTAKWDGVPKKAAEPCLLSYHCKSNYCHHSFCRDTCAPSKPALKCDLDKENCQSIPGKSFGVCVPKPGSGGPGPKKKTGDECYAPEECDSNICMKENAKATAAYCRATCTGPGTCDANFKCVDQGGGYQGCLPGQETYPTGATCKLGKECVSGQCVIDGGKQFCTQTCKPTDPLTCPCGMECHDKGKGPQCFHGKPVACLGAGDPCTAGSQCKSGLCPVGVCLADCDVVAGPVGCPAAEAGCLRLQTGKRKGRCSKPGSKPIGEVCAEDVECATLLCAADPDVGGGKRCIQPCAGKDGSCGTGLYCHSLGGEIGVCAKTPVTNGNNNPPDAGPVGIDAGGSSSSGGSNLSPGVGTTPPARSSTCSVQRSGSPGSMWLVALAMAALVWWRRKRYA